MGIFDTGNSVEAIEPSRRRARQAADMPIREATAAELAAASRRRTRSEQDAASQPVVKAPPQRPGKPAEAEEDTVAKRHGLYTADRGKTRTYFADYRQKQEVMRAEPARIRTRHDDRQTVAAVLDLAQARGWQTLRLRGTEDFRREAWVQAQVRGIATEGHKPSETDRQELARRQAALKPAAAESAPAAAKPVPVRAASPQQAWSAAEQAGATARATDAPKQGQGQQQGKPKAAQGAAQAAAQQATA